MQGNGWTQEGGAGYVMDSQLGMERKREISSMKATTLKQWVASVIFIINHDG